MAEYNSLFIRVTISEEKLQQFFVQKPIKEHVDENWSSWWESRQMYGKQPLAAIPHYQVETNRAVFDQLLEEKHFGSFEYYDKNESSWTFISVFFSENYTEILPMLSLLKNLASYQDAADQGNAIIYDFYWGNDEVMAFVELRDQQAVLHSYTSQTEIQQGTLQGANCAIETVMNEHK